MCVCVCVCVCVCCPNCIMLIRERKIKNKFFCSGNARYHFNEKSQELQYTNVHTRQIRTKRTGFHQEVNSNRDKYCEVKSKQGKSLCYNRHIINFSHLIVPLSLSLSLCPTTTQ